MSFSGYSSAGMAYKTLIVINENLDFYVVTFKRFNQHILLKIGLQIQWGYFPQLLSSYSQIITNSFLWRHNVHDGVSNHQPHGCLLTRLFKRRSKKTSKLRVTGLCVWNSPGPVNSPHKGPVTRNMFPFDDAIMRRNQSMFYNIIPVKHTVFKSFVLVNVSCLIIIVRNSQEFKRKLYIIIIEITTMLNSSLEVFLSETEHPRELSDSDRLNMI